ncbi:MAG: hypothetical protein M5U34_27725 [Chloroflexi bacterium]|nr:hypothetical protein [Chloroflexota bacterium]
MAYTFQPYSITLLRLQIDEFVPTGLGVFAADDEIRPIFVAVAVNLFAG